MQDFKIEEIRSKYGEYIFRFGIGHLFSNGSDNFTDENIEEAIQQCVKEEQELNEKKAIPIMTAEFKMEIINCANELSKINLWEILRYIYCRRLYIGGLEQ